MDYPKGRNKGGKDMKKQKKESRRKEEEKVAEKIFRDVKLFSP